jgi:tRNA(Ile)-lysidine synthase TilS/MesJ
MLESVEALKVFSRNAPIPKCLALTVDHGLQAASATVAAKTRDYALSRSVPHRLLSIPWGENPFPSRPVPGEAFEELARKARNRLLLSAMLAENANVILFGHHADDQVETAVMRLHRGSGIIGLAGMRKIRRWGMGDRDPPNPELGWAGATGMNAWIARPLLNFPKVHSCCMLDSADINFLSSEPDTSHL